MKISIITVCYNMADTIEDSIRSVLSLSYDNVEYIIIDGGSTDGTDTVISRHGSHVAYYVSEPDQGMYDALNKGIERSTGDVIGVLHADDLFYDTAVLSSVAEVFCDPDIDCCWGDLVYVNKKKTDSIIRYWKSSPYSDERIKNGWMMPHPTLFVRRHVFERYGHYDTSFTIAADYDLILRLLYVKKVRGKYIDRVITKMRIGGTSNRTLLSILRKSREDIRVLEKNKVRGVLRAVFLKNILKLPQFFIRKRESVISTAE